ncbi:semaphorin-4B-like isoform X2 [Gouania willdenowi]|uniref:semaphorin-4B-like isoform X2 n=1 Tax=Gouania willdenowi TaxID=441366 RepID=UPI001056A665|nr:semaphorin-4B-like isoform X2 [Gouania willdenowi]
MLEILLLPAFVIIMAHMLLVLILIILSLCDSLPPPRTSFLLHSTVRPLVHFHVPDLNDTITLLLSTDGSTLYVGAQNTVLSLDVSRSDVIALKQKFGQVMWKPSDEEIQQCLEIRNNAVVDCQNFVHVLRQINSSHLYVCGSFGFSPRNAFIDIESFSLVENDRTKGHCPFSPVERTSAITVDGELFTATTTDFRGEKPQISRFLSKDGRPDVNLDLSVGLLNEPQFVSSSWDDAEGKLFFFFTEVGKEFHFVKELRIPRVAQVCKDDVGGQRTLQKKWTSFSKASLLCQSHKQLPFNVLQDVFTLGPAGGHAPYTLFYGVFTSQWSEDGGSAVCVFSLEDVRSVFTGSFKALDMQSGRWSPVHKKHLGKCGLSNASDSELSEVKRSFLTRDSVRPVGGAPLVVSKDRYSRVAAMRTKAANGQEFTVLFLLTESGFLHKMVFDEGPRVIEEVQVFSSPQQLISVVFSLSKEVVYVGTSEGVTAVPTAQCSTSKSCFQCVLSRDPQCGWSPTGGVCTTVEGSQDNLIQTLNGSNPEDVCGQTEAPVGQNSNSLLNTVTECELHSGSSFHSELVLVSLMLVCCVCVLVLVSVYVLRLRRNQIKEARVVRVEEGATERPPSSLILRDT